jgi:hypothetical protein
MNNRVLSLYDFTGEALRPWAEGGFECFAFDIQHDKTPRIESFPNGGSITYVKEDLHSFAGLKRVWENYGENVAFGMAFPVCTDLAVSGARHFKAKAAVDPDFQAKAAYHAMNCATLFGVIGCPYFIENPVSVLATLWRKPDYRFHPYEYGGYIPIENATHPRWPEYIAPFDAYPKRTCLWTGNGFIMPDTKPIEVQEGYATQHLKLGGKSQRTKDIRSATPRGFAAAIYHANKPNKES